jgi:hypothetical protein
MLTLSGVLLRDDRQIELKGLSVPVSISLPVLPLQLRGLSEQRSATCPVNGGAQSLQVSCRYAGAGLNASVAVACDGQAPQAAYRCPIMPRCVFWNKTSEAWSSKGCQTIAVARAGRAVSCKCNHLTTFSTTPDLVELAAVVTSLSLPESEGSLSAAQGPIVLVLMGLLYTSVLLGLVIIRLRRARQSFAFLQ